MGNETERLLNQKSSESDDGSELEAAAIARAKEGDWDAVHFLYVRYVDRVLPYVRSIVRDHHEAEDVTQAVFAKLIVSIRRYEVRDVAFTAWILRVARNAALDHLRTRKQIPVEEVRIADYDDSTEDRGRRECLQAALAELPEEQRHVVVMRHVAGLSPGEIARRMGRSEGSIHGLHHRGRAALRTALSEMGAAPMTRR